MMGYYVFIEKNIKSIFIRGNPSKITNQTPQITNQTKHNNESDYSLVQDNAKTTPKKYSSKLPSATYVFKFSTQACVSNNLYLVLKHMSVISYI